MREKNFGELNISKKIQQDKIYNITNNLTELFSRKIFIFFYTKIYSITYKLEQNNNKKYFKNKNKKKIFQTIIIIY